MRHLSLLVSSALLLALSVASEKTTVKFVGPLPKSNIKRSVQKADSRNCVFDDSLNYACLETSIDLKAGWEVKQKWQVASDINPAAVTQYTGTPAAQFTYVAPDTELNVGYKYRLRLQPYIVFFFNARPNFKIDRLFMGESQFNIDQFKSFFYFDIVYYQKAIHYKYTATAKPADQPDPTGYTGVVGTDLGAAVTRTPYSFLGITYPGKICIDYGYNTEDILLTLKAAVNWRDCYKNFLYTLFDFQNWFGDKALWLDYCDFHTDEDFLIWAYNPYDISKDTGDKTFMQMKIPYEYTGAPTTPVTRKRPASSEANFYRDCYTLDDDIMARADVLISFTFTFMANLAHYFVGFDTLSRYIPFTVTEMDAATLAEQDEQVVHTKDFVDTRVTKEDIRNV